VHDAVFRTMAVCVLVDLPVLWAYRERIKKNAAVSTDAQIAFSKKAEQITTVPHGMQAVSGREAHATPGR
jgi:hypothetical protein